MSKRGWITVLSFSITWVASMASTQAKTPGSPAGAPRAVNPFAGAALYQDPEFSSMVKGVAAPTPEVAGLLKKVATFPTAVWIE